LPFLLQEWNAASEHLIGIAALEIGISAGTPSDKCFDWHVIAKSDVSDFAHLMSAEVGQSRLRVKAGDPVTTGLHWRHSLDQSGS
jgi:hypothetical protein